MLRLVGGVGMEGPNVPSNVPINAFSKSHTVVTNLLASRLISISATNLLKPQISRPARFALEEVTGRFCDKDSRHWITRRDR